MKKSRSVPKRTVAGCVLLLIISATAFGLGQVEMTTPEPVHELFPSDGEIIAQRSVTLSAAAGGTGVNRSYSVGFSAGNTGDPNNRALTAPSGARIPYLILDSIENGNVLKDRGDGGTLLRGVMPAAGVSTESFVVRIFGQSPPAPGLYTDSVTLTAYDWQNNVRDQVDLRIEVTITASIRLSLSSNDLFLGDLAEDVSGSVDMTVYSNANYGIELGSQNGWRMSHTDPAVVSFVPYRLRLDSQVIDLSRNPVIEAGFAHPGAAGHRHLLEVIVGNTDTAVSGPHSDVISITVTAH